MRTDRRLLGLLAAFGVTLAGCQAEGNGNSAVATDAADASDAVDATDSADGADSVDAADAADSADGSDGVDSLSTEPIIDLRVDTNRDGVVDVAGDTDDVAEDQWTAAGGAIFLANIDDDALQCANDLDDVELPECFDAADTVLNGASDVLDMAPMALLAWPGATDAHSATLTIAPEGRARIFRHVQANNPEAWGVVDAAGLTGTQLRAGAELRLEGIDIVRDQADWDGFITVKLEVMKGAESVGVDEVRMRISPVMTYHHLLPAEVVYATYVSKDSQQFRADIDAGIEDSGTKAPFIEVQYGDQWVQDFFEPAYMSMPGPDGKQHAIRVNYRSANVESSDKGNPLRTAGRFAYDLRGADSAAVQQYDLGHDGYMDSLNSFGNTETIPPYTKDEKSYPLGRVFRGSVESFYPDPKFSKMVESQLIQPPVHVDTSWLVVGHVDESVTFLPTGNARGWTIGVNDAPMAKKMFEALVEDKQEGAAVFSGKDWSDGDSARTTVAKILANEDVLTASSKSAAEVDAQLEILLEATGVGRDELVPFAFLHEELDGYSVAYQPGTVNGLLIDSKTFVAPKPHGPTIDGKDPFETQVVEALAKIGMTASFAEDWDLFHRLLGEVHCGSNVTRQIPSALWWESGR